MTEEIKQRIEMINCGEVPQGYKKTKIGIVPIEWEVRKLGKFIKIQSGCSPSQVEFAKTGMSYYKVDCLNCGDKYIESNQYFIKKTNNLIEKNSLIFPKRGAAILGNKIRINNSECMIDTNLMALTGLGAINILFLYYYLIKVQLYRIADTSTIPQINNKHIEPLKIFSPPFPEQEKIAEILAICDKVIELKKKLILEKQREKKWLVQNLLTGKKRLKGFDGEWKKVKLGSVLSIRDVKQVPTNEAPLMAFVASIGISPKGDRYDRSFLVKDIEKKYKRTEINDFIYSSNNLDVGSIGLNKFGTAVISVVYEIFTVKPDLAVPTILSEIIQTPYNMQKVLAFRQGALYGQYKIHAKDFLSVKIRIPNFKEQTAITNILITADKEIELLQKDLCQWKQKKKALMQLLLNGKVRVK